MPGINTTVIGNLTADPELRFTPSGAAVANLTIAVNERYKDSAGQWQDGATSFVRANCWRNLAEHVTESFKRGDRVIAVGVFRQREYETKEGEKRQVWELAASEIGASANYATLTLKKTSRDRVPPAEDPWASANTAPSGPPADEPPF